MEKSCPRFTFKREAKLLLLALAGFLLGLNLAVGGGDAALATGGGDAALAVAGGDAALAVGGGDAALAVGGGDAALPAGRGYAALPAGRGDAAWGDLFAGGVLDNLEPSNDPSDDSGETALGGKEGI